MSFIRKLKRALKGLELDRDVTDSVLDTVEDLMDEGGFEPPEPNVPEPQGGDDNKTEIELLKEQHATELAKAKLDAKIELALSQANIQDGYVDLVTKSIDMSKVSIDDDGKLVGLDDQIKQLTTDKPLLFKPEQKTELKGATPQDSNKKPVGDGIDFKNAKYDQMVEHLENGGELPK